MAARLGNVLYWLGCLVAAASILWAIVNAWVLFTGSLLPMDNVVIIMISLAAAVAAWVVGRACRYILAGT